MPSPATRPARPPPPAPSGPARRPSLPFCGLELPDEQDLPPPLPDSPADLVQSAGFGVAKRFEQPNARIVLRVDRRDECVQAHRTRRLVQPLDQPARDSATMRFARHVHAHLAREPIAAWRT